MEASGVVRSLLHRVALAVVCVSKRANKIAVLMMREFI